MVSVLQTKISELNTKIKTQEFKPLKYHQSLGKMASSDDEDKPVIVDKDEVVKAIEASNIADKKEDGNREFSKIEDHDEKKDSPSPQEEEVAHSGSPHLPIQICSVGTDENEYAFTFHEERLNSILETIPAGRKISVVSVVGAFRTGKSFLLSWFLRYLHHHSSDEKKIINSEEEKDGKLWYEQFDSLGKDGFHWRGGAERNTTGIWMWSQPYFMERKLDDGSTEEIAVVLVDTQGMFDHETTMGLTAAIFGLSTLLSSYQIYNVDKRIQEDNLQQLALFTEYGRMALHADEESKIKMLEKKITCEYKGAKKGPKNATKKEAKLKPFQKIEFLVRDWQNFDDEDDLDQCELEMKKHLEDVIAERAAADLKDTRDQINSCFEEISCYMFTHPGIKVTKKTYAGEVKHIDDTFLALLDRFCHRVFNVNNLTPKKIHGRELTAAELGVYIKEYAAMFTSGAHFPEASTMLEATANANNSNATNLSVRKYEELMDKVAGPRVDVYTQSDIFEKMHQDFMREVNDVFESIANFGSSGGIEKARQEMMRRITEDFELYNKLNESRNPLAGLEM